MKTEHAHLFSRAAYCIFLFSFYPYFFYWYSISLTYSMNCFFAKNPSFLFFSNSPSNFYSFVYLSQSSFDLSRLVTFFSFSPITPMISSRPSQAPPSLFLLALYSNLTSLTVFSLSTVYYWPANLTFCSTMPPDFLASRALATAMAASKALSD